ncbi:MULTISPECIES: PLD nuclease N-terminal domain-containing protein [Subtercola]|uniref:PLDc_N domain-containing protein n=1 Tax=Subtercola vilae TaxID=2056433 RepID=A0A4T2C4J8_9MICO|nr:MULTISPECIES: PLD nuclease N-terminal domain-containing protein [Subtercola]MEA9984779.1 PLD nuclease N-terminal domain-containing protein [Subtercola sp. RTI3]TIH38990.1 PLDc_N domain-containing protein [Subtercola vilae]
MARLLVGLVAIAVAFYVYALVDCLLFARVRVRGLPKVAWVLIVLLFPVIGGVLWFLIGRGRKSAGKQPVYRTVGPDDDPEFLGALRVDPVSEAQLRDLEQALADVDDDPDNKKSDNGRSER